MAHFAKINNNNIVTEVIVAEQDFINSGAVGDSFLWVQTSYNNNFRKQFAAIGMTYDKTKEKFIFNPTKMTMNHKEYMDKNVIFWSKYWFKDPDTIRILNLILISFF